MSGQYTKHKLQFCFFIPFLQNLLFFFPTSSHISHDANKFYTQ